MNDTHVTCPNCGYGFENLRKSTRMFDCPSCDTTLFREADAIAQIGRNGEMHDYPMLLSLNDTVTSEGSKYTVVGHARYDYGRGTWDEMYAENAQGQGVWISIDEGDVVVQHPYDGNAGPRRSDPAAIGERISYQGRDYIVTEADTATCIAVRGQFPELVQVGDGHYFLNASGPSGQLLSGEFWEGGHKWYEGVWKDPFSLKVDRAHGGSGR
ncbi:DUF4178 domain-containing protein [Hasllibacter sp. MH4015]|uniref:DUF4178 domain-containing protein n=1 Tax=Hasllibacter sp. MH4015 TaxID=2854029 RepID=UPI001CD2CC2C|nr:DUF4178 domain-containing protein [Hasllibacter sp. MH4015]